jgi:hypothetical protein
MRGVITNEGMITVGNSVVLEARSPSTSFAAVFEDDGDAGYFYGLNTDLEQPIIDALHIYNSANVTDRDIPSKVQIAWSMDGLKTALIINAHVHAIFDFEAERGYCRTGFPPITDWSKEGHEWHDDALTLFS